MNLAEARKAVPTLANLDDQSFIEASQRLFYPNMSVESLSKALGYKPPTKDDTLKSNGIIGDTAVGLAKGVVAIPQAVVGVGDLVSGGAIGKAVQDAGVDFNAAQENLDKRYSPAQQKANEAVSQADGFWDTLGAMAKNPSTIYQGVLQSAPLMVAGGYLGGAAQVAAKGLGVEIGQATAAALGEGISMAGSSAEQIRTDKNNPNGELTPVQSLAAAGVGILGGGIAKASGALSNSQGVGYIAGFGSKKSAAELAQAEAAAANSGLTTRIAKGMGIEGAEEVAQTVPETAFQNLANDKEWDKGMGSQLAGSLLTGAAMGGAGAPFHGGVAQATKKTKDDAIKVAETAAIGSAPDVDSAISAFTASVAPTQSQDVVASAAPASPVDAIIQDAQSKTGAPSLEVPLPNAITPEAISSPAATLSEAVQPTSVVQPAIETPQAALSSQETPQNEFRTLGSEAFTSGIPRVPPESLPKADKQSWLGGWDAANIASPTPFTPAKTEKEAALSQALKAKKQAKLNEMLSPEQIADLEPKPAAAAQPEIDPIDMRYGKDNKPLHEGGKPFKTKNAAKVAKEQQPMMRVVSVKGGFALADKTPAQLAAHEAAGKRLGRTQIGQAGMPYAAHEFLASLGGLSQNTKADLGIDGNPRIGNRRLFAAAGRGLSIEEATAKLLEAGYISADDQNAAYNVIQRSVRGEPQYTAEGFEHIAQMEADSRFEDHLQAHQEAAETDPDYDPFTDSSLQDDFIPEDMPDAEYNRASIQQKAEVAALADKLAAIGYDPNEIIDDLLGTSIATNEREFYAEIKQHFDGLITKSSGAVSDTVNREVDSLNASEGRSKGEITEQGNTANNGKSDTSQSNAPASSEADGDSNTEAVIKKEPIRWKILEKATNTVLAETDDKRKVNALDKSKFEAIPVYEKETPKLELTGKTLEEERKAIKDAEAAQKAAAKEEARLAEAEKKARDDADVKLRAEAAAGRFELGGNAMDELSGQTDMMSSAPQSEADSQEPITPDQAANMTRGTIVKDSDGVKYYAWSARFDRLDVMPIKDGKPVVYAGSEITFALTDRSREANPEYRHDALYLDAAPASTETNADQQSQEQPSADRLRAEADLQAALADLGDIVITSSGARSIIPQDNQKLLPVLVRLFDAAFRLGYYKFKDAAKFALDNIRKALGNDVADSITLDHLQGAYIAMAGGKSEADNIRTVSNIEDKKEIENHVAKAHNGAKESSNVPNTNASDESNIAGASTARAVGDTVQDERGEPASGDRESGGQTTGSEGRREQGDTGVQTGSTVAGGERSDQLLRGEIGTGQSEIGDARTDFGERSGDSGITGVPPETIPAKTVIGSATTGTDEIKQKVAQKDAPTHVEVASLENVRETLPALLKNQQEDVHTAEVRFAKPDGYGMLFTNGTGTGKTFVGLGVVKRFALQGKTNTLIVVPDAKIAEDWAQSGKLLGLNILPLPSTADAGRGIVVTTYANLRANDSLAKRNWDLVISDEAHELMANAQSEETSTLKNLRAITNHPDGARTRYEMLNRPDIKHLEEINAKIKENGEYARAIDTPAQRKLAAVEKNKLLDKARVDLNKKLSDALEKVREDVAAIQGAARTRAVFLSATPFAYEKNIQWAQGYLFEYPQVQEGGRDYNRPDGYQQYMIENFGYRMKFNKLTEPDAKVNRGLMQRQFNTRLKKEGVLSGRMLDVVPDYDRRFVLVDSAIGNKIDEAMDWLKDETSKAQDENKGKPKDQQTNGMALLRDHLSKNFDYLARRYLLEGIKAKEAVAIVKSHIALGRKVVVFHDYKKGDSKNPFDIRTNQIQFEAGTDQNGTKVAAVNQAITAFRAKFPELVNGLNDLDSPIETFKRELPETLLVNGNEKRSDLLKRYKHFQDDSTGSLVMLVQSAKNKGWSGHDTTGVNQRVLINLGQPTAPTLAIQQEGRIYRTGQFSNAIMRYLNTGTNWEKWAFATTIASRASTAENLGMGESSRALKDSFINAFEESDKYPAGHEGEGTGGKERDKAANNALSEFDRAKSYYFSQLKKTSKTKAQEGADYFATPEPLGMKMAQWLDTHAGDKTLEPSAGHGAISRFLSDESKRTVIEPSTTLRSRLALVMNPEDDRILDGDFESLDITNKYDGIVMNPPFGVGGKTAIEHVAKAATHLRDGGRIVALIPSGGMADKRLEQWLYGETEKPIKPLFKAGATDIYKGDTLHISDLRGEFTVEVTSYDSQNEVVRGVGLNGRVIASGVSGIERIGSTGARTEAIKNAPDLHLIADIKLPSSTFERAGTSVATHVIVLQKGDTNIQQRNIDLTDSEDINDLFDKIEDVDFAKREQVEQEAPKLDSRSAVLPISTPAAQTGDMVKLGEKEYPVETYTTNAGKDIRGAWVDSRDEALKYGKTTFPKNRKWFVRERDFPEDDTAFSRGGNSPIWRSALADNVETINAKAQSEEGWRLNILGLVNKGKVKADEVEWSGVNEWLKLQEGQGKVTKEQVMDYLNGNGVQVTETVLGDGDWAVYDGDYNQYFGSQSEANAYAIEQGINITEDTVFRATNKSGGYGSKYSQYQLAGGENYREVLLTLPRKEKTLTEIESELGYETGKLTNAQQDEVLKRWKQYTNKSSDYQSSHWEQANVLAHIRLNDRTDADGNKVLFVEELQSDWGQDGKKKGFKSDALPAKLAYDAYVADLKTRYEADVRKDVYEEVKDPVRAERMIANIVRKVDVGGMAIALGEKTTLNNFSRKWNDEIYKSEKLVPAAPFVTSTDKWLTLALKRIVKLAVDEGYDKVAFINGEQSADRYDLSKSVDEIVYSPQTQRLIARNSYGEEIIRKEDVKQEQLADFIGKDAAEKIMKQQPTGIGNYTLKGAELKLGGEGMKAFYDKIVPSAAKEVIRKLGGGQIEPVSIDTAPSFTNTPDYLLVRINQTSDRQFRVGIGSGDERVAETLPTLAAAEAWGKEQQKIARDRRIVRQQGFTITDKMREHAADGLPMFKKQASTGMAIEAVQALVDKLSDKIDVTVVATPADLPVPAPSDAKGLYHNGKAWIVASNNANAREVAETYAHEVIGHYGLRAMLGREDFAKTMGLIQLALKSGNKPLNAIRDRIRKTYVDENGKFNLTPNQEADEIAAAVAQNAIDENGNLKAGFSFMKAVYAKIAQFLRDMGIDIKFTNAELQGLLTASLKQLGVGEKMDGGNVTVLSRKFIQTNTAAFKNWFGNSDIVDKNGRPMVMYHGTGDPRITEFKPQGESAEKALALFKEAVKNNTPFGYMNFRSGSFFSPHPEYAGNYTGENSGVMYPVYIKAENPIYIDQRTKKATLKIKGRTPDTLIFHDGGIINEVAVIDPTQIKSAIGNNGNFDPTNPDIRYSRGDDLLTPYTEAEARAKQEREEQLLKEEQRPAPTKPSKKVTADQVDLFNPQGGLFSRSPLTTSLNNAYGSIDGLKERTTALANDLFSHAGTVSWWDKTVGTMQNLAKRSPAFNRVYEATQNFLGDVSTYATNASKLAPSLLPTLDNMRDLVKPLLNAKDKEATARAVWEGTLLWARDDKGRLIKAEDKIAKADKLTVHDKAADLLAAHAVSPNVLKMWQGLQIDEYEKIINGKYESEFLQTGVVFSDKELKDKFDMSDRQIELYREFRATTDKSLTDMALSEMTRLAGKDGTSIEGLNLEKASEKLRDHLMAQSDEKPDLLNTANKIIDIANNTNRLLKNGYAPLMRFGHFTLDVMVNGEREYFGLFESKFEANKMARIMQRNYPDGVITQGTMNDQAYKEFEGISPETAEIYGQILGLDSQGTSEADKAHREFIKASTSNRSALRRLLHRKGIAGFNEDIGRVLAGFVYSNSRRSASNIHTGEIKEAIQAIPKNEGELGAMATKLREYVQNPQEEAQALRGLLFMQYLGGSIASAMVNLTQPFAMTFPFLAQYGGVKKSAARMIEASKLAISDKVSKELADAIEKAKADGHITPQEVHTLMAQAQGRMSMTSGDGTKAGDAAAWTKNGLIKTMFAWGRLFAMAEVSNRKVTFIAAYNTALEEGIEDPYHFAINAINETQGVYNKANKPQWARGAIGSTLFTFKQYSVNYVELFYRLAFAGKEGSLERANGRKAAILMAATLFLMAGAGGLPFAEDIDDMIDGLMESLGYSFSSKQAKHNFFAAFLGQDGAKFAEKGVSGITGVPFDVGGRLGMGNLIPATGLLIKKQDHGNDVAEIFGAAGDLAKRAYMGSEKALSLEFIDAAKAVAPKAASNALQGLKMAKEDMYRDAKGNKVIDTDLTDAMFKGIGFQPNDVAQAQEANRYKQKIKDQLVSKEAEIADKMAQAMFERDQDKRQEASEQLRKWNEDNPDLPIRIKQEQILRRVLAMRQTREQRIMKSAPKEIRATLRSEQ
jgi:ADP-Ribosyltransferase in polyvalent proteins/Type III restriction enzyme, res subunit/Methyltransferase small domain